MLRCPKTRSHSETEKSVEAAEQVIATALALPSGSLFRFYHRNAERGCLSQLSKGKASCSHLNTNKSPARKIEQDFSNNLLVGEAQETVALWLSYHPSYIYGFTMLNFRAIARTSVRRVPGTPVRTKLRCSMDRGCQFH